MLLSGTSGGYYDRLAAQIVDSANTAVSLRVDRLPSQGSRENLQRLLDRQADFAIVQLDVANDVMQQGKIQAVALLANEHVHVMTQADSALKTFNDLDGKRVAIGAEGSGIRYTATQLIQATSLKITEVAAASLEESLAKLDARQADAVMYVGSIGASQKLRQRFAQSTNLRLLPLPASLTHFLNISTPGAYQVTAIPSGSYRLRPMNPPEDVPTLATATVVVTRPDVDGDKVGLLTWSILSTARQYTRFYPELQNGEGRSLLQRGLLYIHPAAQDVYENGDPRDVWIRYLEKNSDLQSGLVILLGTSGIGLLLQRWRNERSKKLIGTTAKRLTELRQLLPHDTEAALQGIEDLQQEHRLMFIEGTVATDVYEQVRQKTQMFADECRSLLEQQRKKLVLDMLIVVDDWQTTLRTNPDDAFAKLNQIKQQYREMLLSDKVDIDTYIELIEMTMISLIAMSPRSRRNQRDTQPNVS